MPTYTVVALIDLDTAPPEMLIAGVAEGERNMVDTDPGSIITTRGAFLQRYASSVEAADPDEAERVAREEYEDTLAAEREDG